VSDRIAELEAELAEAKGEIDDLKTKILLLEDEVSEVGDCDCIDYDGDEFIPAETVADIRRFVHRKQYEDAIELADRELPSRLRYAT
jgi:hypothetical protein